MEDFKLPAKWCVKVTTEDKEGKVPEKYRCGAYKENYYIYSEVVQISPNSPCNPITGGAKMPDFKEITFKQFEQHVLNKNISLEYTKVQINSEEDCRLVQEKAFKLGFTWSTGNTDLKYLNNSPYLVFYKNTFVRCLSRKFFESYSNKQLTVHQILSIKTKENVNNKQESTQVQRFSKSIRRSSSRRKPRFTSSENQISNRGRFSRIKKRPIFTEARIS